jgi:hypothetical protein
VYTYDCIFSTPGGQFKGLLDKVECTCKQNFHSCSQDQIPSTHAAR